MANPLWMHALLNKVKHHPLLVMLLLLVGAYLLKGYVAPAAPVVRAQGSLPAQAVPGQGIQRTVLEASVNALDRKVTELTQQEAEREKVQRATQQEFQQKLAAMERDHQAQLHAQQQQFDQQLQQAQRTTPHPPPAAPGGAKKPAPPAGQPLTDIHKALAPGSPHAVIQILRNRPPEGASGPPPVQPRADTPYLPAGSFAVGKVVTGVMATSRNGGELPVLLSISKAFTAPWQLQGPSVTPLPMALPLAGCFIGGSAAADLGASRVVIKTHTLSCVFADAAAFEHPFRGYVVDRDGTYGVVGRLETHDSAIIAKSFLTGLLAGAGEAFASARRTVSLTPLGGQQSAVTGNVGELAGFSALADASAQLSRFYLQQASQLLPTLWLPAGVEMRVVLQEGIALEGLPTLPHLSTQRIAR